MTSAVSQKSLKFLLEFYCFILVVLFMIFSIPLFFPYVLLQIFLPISMFSHSFVGFLFAGVPVAGEFLVAWKFPGCEFSQPVEFHRMRNLL